VTESGKDYGRFGKGYFGAQVKAHLVFYKINKKSQQIEIIRILYKRMDINSQLSD